MGKIKKATKKVDIQALKKARRFNKKVVKGKKVSEKSMANFREVESEEEEELQLEEKQPIRNTKIVNNENEEDDDDEDDDEEMDGEDDDEEDDDEPSVELDSKEKALSKKKDSKDPNVKDSDKTKSLKEQISQHKKDMEALKLKDPKLFEFLGENDKELLNFNSEMDDVEDDDDDDTEDEDDDVEGAEESEGKKQPQEKKQKEVLTSALLDSWITDANKSTTIQNVKKLVVAFRSASRAGSDLKENAKVPYKILNSAVFNRTLIICLENMPKFFDKLLGYDSIKQTEEDPNHKTELPNTTEKWNIVKSCINSFIKSIIHLLTQVSEPKLLLIILKGLEKVICYTACFTKYSKLLLKQLLTNWSSSEESVRIVAFLCIRKLAILCPFPFIDDCLKGVYLNFVRNSKFVSTTSLPIINFMCNCVIEIYGLDFSSSYRSAFVFVRQLAVHLRNSLNTNTKDAFQNIYNWQFINSVRAWVEVLSAYPGQEQISQLLYPITQIIIGIINLIPSSKFLPLRFHCIRFLNRLAETNGTFINCTPYLLEVLDCSEMKNSGKGGNGGNGGNKGSTASAKNKFINFYTTLAANHQQLNSKEFQDGVLSQFTELLVENLNCFNYHIGFPELCTPVILHLKKALKSKQYKQKVQTDIQEILDALEKTSKLVKSQRDQVTFSPKESKQIQAFTELLKEKYKITPLKQLLLALKKKSRQLQQTIIDSTKTYNYEDDEEQQDDDESDLGSEGNGTDEEDFDDDEEQDDDEEDDDEEDLYHEDEEQEKQPSKKSKTNTTSKPKKPKFKVQGQGQDEDMVEDLVLSDNE